MTLTIDELNSLEDLLHKQWLTFKPQIEALADPSDLTRRKAAVDKSNAVLALRIKILNIRKELLAAPA